MFDMAALGRQPIDAAKRADINAALQIFCQAARVIAGQAFFRRIVDERKMSGCRFINTTQPAIARCDPQAACLVDV